jgi:uncharacterized protein (DUF934 family)
MELFLADDPRLSERPTAGVRLANDQCPLAWAATVNLNGNEGNIALIELEFPQFTDGRAFSQAYLLRKRLGYRGPIRAVGQVLIDQLLQMQRTGFTQAVLRVDQDIAHARQLLAHYADFYQGDATGLQPRFQRVTA